MTDASPAGPAQNIMLTGMGGIFESTDPVPLGVAGALLFSFLGFTSLNIYSQVGLITLVGLVAKNGILIVEFANHLQQQGKAKLQAILEASETRLRPILMTTAATVVGHFPLVLAPVDAPAQGVPPDLA